jgi:protein-glutamine gamma-glutamyltransferase
MHSPRDHSLTPRLQLQLYLLTGLVLLPHVRHLPIPVTLFLFITLGWRLASLWLPKLIAGRLLLLLFTMGGVALIYSQHQTLLGRDAGVSLLSIMLVLKTLEVRKRRDLYVTIFIAYFVVVTQFLFDQSFTLLLYLLLVLVGHTSLLLEINRVVPSRRPFTVYRQTLLMTLQALPIAIILFVMFPRLTHPIWQFGLDASASTGLSDQVRPGTISQLIQSSEVAFRASFEGAAPPPETRYWRALVLWDTDGQSWFTQQSDPLPDVSPQLSQSAHPVRYEIFLEPHRKHWLFALDLPAEVPANIHRSVDYLLSVSEAVNRPLQYKLLSYIQYQTLDTSPALRQRALKLPANITERERALVAQWQAGSNTQNQLITKALDFFHRNEFVYTLNPPAYLTNPIDEFLFEGREGFCEHYATAFTQLMRVAGIPARLVIGYQGGEFNRVGNYYTIRQYDAHAWTEVWLKDQGWVRIDPTAAVAPERIRNAIQPTVGSVGDPVMFRLDKTGLIGSMLSDVGMFLDNSNLQWRRWVLAYSREEQFGLIRELGLDFLATREWGFIIIGLVGMVLGLIAWRLIQQGRVKLDPVLSIYRRFCRRLAAIGLPRQAHEGPLDYATRVSQQRPDLAHQIKVITSLYVRCRYGVAATPSNRLALARWVRRFRPRAVRN